MSWQSTTSYYRLLNEEVGRRLGRHHCADLRIWSGDFERHHQAQLDGDDQWEATTMVDAARGLVAGGAELLAIASNTVHKHADLIESMAGAPVVNIIDATAHRIQATGLENVLVLGTDYTMSGDFYKVRMAESGINCMMPEDADRAEIHRIIFEELVHGDVDDGSHRTLVDIIDAWAEEGAEGAVLACTELSLILNEDDGLIPGFDTTRIHCQAIVDAALTGVTVDDGQHLG
jgi:aspartate racemase